jgi:hypothetical protein
VDWRESNARVSDHGYLARYQCPVKRCGARVWWLVNTELQTHRLPPWCDEAHGSRRQPRMTLEATLPITDHLPWIMQAAEDRG